MSHGRHTAVPDVLAEEPDVRPGPAVLPAVDVRDRAPRGDPARRASRLVGRADADPAVAAALPSARGSPRLGGAPPRAARRVIPGIPTLHGRIAAVSLSVAGRHGFALGGGCAWVAHGIVRPREGSFVVRRGLQRG